MLIKAVLTGGVLSVLAGLGVYIGTEGVDVDASESVRIEETAMAGAADMTVEDLAGAADVAVGDVASVAVAEVDVQDPPAKASEPKTKWLDQYLKKSKSKTKAEPKVEPAQEAEVESVVDVKTVDEAIEVVDEPIAETENKPSLRVIKRIISDGGSDHATGTYVVSNSGRVETLDIKGDVNIETLKDELGLDSDKNVEIRVIRKMGNGKSMTILDTKTQKPTDYAPILVEAKKLLVTDMRNQAFLEIIDHAVDNEDMAQAADIVQELSTPELRDTARARIGTGLARCGKTEAAFAVLDEIEIDELAAPIRLEIITALMATKQERRYSTPQR